jgi:hypothetical protein
MAEIKEFVVNDRRKFTAEGDIRPDAPPSEPRAPRPETLQPQAPPADAFDSSARLTTAPEPVAAAAANGEEAADAPPALTAEQTSAASTAYTATVDRLDTAIRSANPGMAALPEMSFERVLQSLYMQALMQLGGMTQEGQQPQVDLLGARQTIDMLAVLDAKTKGNLTDTEAKLMDTALFELRMGFLEVTNHIARQAQAAKQTPPPTTSKGGPQIVR